MMGASKIEWTDATWNPIVGCSVVSPGCTNCYAMRMASRIEATYGNGNAGHYLGTTKKINGNAVWTGKLALAPEKTLTSPLRRKTPTMYFVNSMGDLFHEDCPDEWIDRVVAVMAMCQQHTFQILTKRAERMQDYFSEFMITRGFNLGRGFDIVDQERRILGSDKAYFARQEKTDGYGTGFSWPLKNCWLGISCERQEEADERIPLLLQTPAAVRFISAEPLLGPIDLDRIDFRKSKHGSITSAITYDDEEPRVDQVIVGGESGPNARPMNPNWARSLRDQCQASGVS